MDAFGELLNQVHQDWNQPNNHILDYVFCSPTITLDVRPYHFMKDYNIFQVNYDKLGKGFQGNKLGLNVFLNIWSRLHFNHLYIYI